MRYPHGSMVYFGEKIHLEMDEKWMRTRSSPISGNPNWLVGQGHPSEKWWSSSIKGWWHDPKISGKMPNSWQPFTTKQPLCMMIGGWCKSHWQRPKMTQDDPRMTPVGALDEFQHLGRDSRDMGDPQARWMVFVRGNPIVRNGGWFRGYPHDLGNLHWIEPLIWKSTKGPNKSSSL